MYYVSSQKNAIYSVRIACLCNYFGLPKCLPKRYFSLLDQFKTLQRNKKLHFYRTAEQCSFRKGNQIFWPCFYWLKLSHSELLPTFNRWKLSTSNQLRLTEAQNFAITTLIDWQLLRMMLSEIFFLSQDGLKGHFHIDFKSSMS